MAGSYNHCVDQITGRLRDPKTLAGMLDCTSGDVYEAVQEMYGMVWLLAHQLSEDYGGQLSAEQLVEDARLRYPKGLELSPGLNTDPALSRPSSWCPCGGPHAAADHGRGL